MLDRLGPKATKRVGGKAWAITRPQFERIHNFLVSASADASVELATVYVKYTVPAIRQPFAVLWVKKSTELVLGLALPEDYTTSILSDAPNHIVYAGLTKYLCIHPGDPVPSELSKWAKDALVHAMSLPVAIRDANLSEDLRGRLGA